MTSNLFLMWRVGLWTESSSDDTILTGYTVENFNVCVGV